MGDRRRRLVKNSRRVEPVSAACSYARAQSQLIGRVLLGLRRGFLDRRCLTASKDGTLDTDVGGRAETLAAGPVKPTTIAWPGTSITFLFFLIMILLRRIYYQYAPFHQMFISGKKLEPVFARRRKHLRGQTSTRRPPSGRRILLQGWPQIQVLWLHRHHFKVIPI